MALSHPFPPVLVEGLPQDIVRLILEELFNDSGYKDRISLILLSKQVQQWLGPVLYRDMEIAVPKTGNTDLVCTRVRHMLSQHQSLSLVQTFAQSLYVCTSFAQDAEQSADLVTELLPSCHRLYQLCVWSFWELKHVEKLLAITSPQLHRLKLFIHKPLFGPAFSFQYPLFQSLTHLDLCLSPNDIFRYGTPAPNWPEDENGIFCGHVLSENLHTLSRLTHLSLDIALNSFFYIRRDLNQVPFGKWIQGFLARTPPTLMVLIFSLPHETTTTAERRRIYEGCDHRTMLEMSDREGELEDWEQDFVIERGPERSDWRVLGKDWSEPDIWELAERALERRRVNRRGQGLV